MRLHQGQALADGRDAEGRPLDNSAIAALEAEHAYTWTTATKKYSRTQLRPSVTRSPAVSAAMR